MSTSVKRVGAVLAGVVVVVCLVLDPLVTAIVLGALVVLGVGYLFLVFFAPPRRAATFAELSERRWRTIDLGPGTVSADGSRYAIYARRGTSPNLVIHFGGGGACWDGHSAARPITPLRVARGYTRDLRAFYFASLTRLFPAGLGGLADRKDAANPFREWTIVFLPYSTGDLHLGRAERTYTDRGREIRVQHHGQANVAAALAWVFANVGDVEKVLVSGESSGAWAAACYVPTVADHYPGASVSCLSDGAGIVSPRWPELVDQVWQADAATHLGFRVGADLYADALLHRVDGPVRTIRYLHANTLYDDTLTRFGAALDGLPTSTDQFIDDWADRTRASMHRLSESGLDYRCFLTDWGHDGKRHTTAHTITTNELFHRCRADGVTYADWLRRNVIDDEPLSLGTGLLTGPTPTVGTAGVSTAETSTAVTSTAGVSTTAADSTAAGSTAEGGTSR